MAEWHPGARRTGGGDARRTGRIAQGTGRVRSDGQIALA
jgi:hypothetical protein